MHIFAYVVNSVIDWFKDTTIETWGYSFTLWSVALASIIICTGGYIVGCFLREKE